jgi:hypothetical protein
VKISGRVRILYQSANPNLREFSFCIGELDTGEFFGDYILGLPGNVADVSLVGLERGELACVSINEFAYFPAIKQQFLLSSTILTSEDDLIKKELARIEFEYEKAKLMYQMYKEQPARKQKYLRYKALYQKLSSISLTEVLPSKRQLTLKE